MTVTAKTPAKAFEPKRAACLNQRYELEERIGEGGMGEVWRARDLSLKRQVAIKFLSGSLAAKEEVRTRFLHEAQVTAQINSRHAVLVYDFGVTADGQPYFVLELLHGETLAKRLGRVKKLDKEQAFPILRKAARALSRAHALRIVHRDFKPDNVFLTVSEESEEAPGGITVEEVKVVDFGIAKLIGSLEEARHSMHDEDLTGEALGSLTRTNSFIGTPHYMSPEQVRQEEVGPAADIWALAIVAFECLTGRHPFEGNNVIALFSNIQLGRSLAASELEPSLGAGFDTWFKRATALDPKDRFGDANTAVEQLGRTLFPMRPMSPSLMDMTSQTDVSSLLNEGSISIDGIVPQLAQPPRPPRSKAAIFAGVGLCAVAAIIGLATIGKKAPATAANAVVVTTPSAPPSASAAPSSNNVAESASAASSSSAAAPEHSAPVPSASASHGRAGAKPPRGAESAPSGTATSAPAESAKPVAPAPPKPTSSSPFALPPLGL